MMGLSFARKLATPDSYREKGLIFVFNFTPLSVDISPKSGESNELSVK
jgi:hypothetical protein